MSNKEKYSKFCESVYVPIYSKSWWLDAVCGEDNWDVWLFEGDAGILAAMPYYFELRGTYRYITKALLSQNNGIIFNYPSGIKEIAKQSFEEKVIEAACEYIASLNVDVYEQQYHYEFRNWLPFFWNRYTAITRYTYVIEGLGNIDNVWNDISSKYRNKIRKGQKNALFETSEDYVKFYEEHEKIFMKQDLPCPFSFSVWERLYKACAQNNAGELLLAKTEDGEIASVMFLVWDEQSAYQLLGGSMPDFRHLDTYDALIWYAINRTAHRGLKYDFEGSVIKRISKSFREFGGEPKPYFRIRKVFNPEIVRKEAEEQIKYL